MGIKKVKKCIYCKRKDAECEAQHGQIKVAFCKACFDKVSKIYELKEIKKVSDK